MNQVGTRSYFFEYEEASNGILLKVNGRKIVIQGVSATLMRSFCDNGGAFISKADLYAKLYECSAKFPSIKILDVFVWKLRKKLNDACRGSGACLQTRWGDGYGLFNTPCPFDASAPRGKQSGLHRQVNAARQAMIESAIESRGAGRQVTSA